MLSIECQLAQAQMSRYLAGDVLPPDSLAELETHVSKCDACKAYAEEQRISLEQMLATGVLQSEGPAPGESAGDAPATDEPKGGKSKRKKALSVGGDDPIAEFEGSLPLADMEAPAWQEPEGPADSAPTGDQTPKPKRKIAIKLPQIAAAGKVVALAKKNVKAVALSGVLAVVLIAMSFIAADPTRIFGSKAKAPAKEKPKEELAKGEAAPKVVAEAAKEAAEPESTPVENPGDGQIAHYAMSEAAAKAGEGAPVAAPETHAAKTPEHPPTEHPKPVTPATPKASTAPVIVATTSHAQAPSKPSKPQAKTNRNHVSVVASVTKRKPKPTTKSDTGTIVVFDEHGKPIRPAAGD